MYKHWWYTVDQGIGIMCDKCDKYMSIYSDEYFLSKEKVEDCPISDNKIEDMQ